MLNRQSAEKQNGISSLKWLLWRETQIPSGKY